MSTTFTRKGQVGQPGNRGQFAKGVFAEAEEFIDFEQRRPRKAILTRDEALDRLEASEFYARHGHINVPQRQDWGDWHVGHWVMGFKKSAREGKVEKHHLERALRLGMRWEAPKHVTADEGFDRLEQLARDGHDPSKLPVKLEVDGWKPKRWVDNLQRSYTRGSLSEDQIRRAERLGIVFKGKPAVVSATKLRQRLRDEDTIKKLEALELSSNYLQHGIIALGGDVRQDSAEGRFIARLRDQYHAGKLSEEVIAEADKRGFEWGKGPRAPAAHKKT